MKENSFLGTWRLVSGDIVNSRGELAVRLTDGVLHYSADGLVAAQCALSPDSADEKMRLEVGDYIAYFGQYTVFPEEHRIDHFVTASNVAAYVGTVLPRHFTFVGARLILRPDLRVQLSDGARARGAFVWNRSGG